MSGPPLDCVAKLILRRPLKSPRAAGELFVQRSRGPHRLAPKPTVTSVARQRLHESSISSGFVFSSKNWTAATFAFCNTIPLIPDIVGAPGFFRSGRNVSERSYRCVNQLHSQQALAL